jgi:hypothetical protein
MDERAKTLQCKSIPAQPGTKQFPSLIAKWIAALGKVAPHHGPGTEIALDAFASLKDRVALHVIEDGHAALRGAVQTASIDAVIPAIVPLPPSIGVPWAGYITDFQHRYTCRTFSRKRNFASGMRYAWK